ncbi:OmpH family outer membrane protein [Pontitalea aquivivens]|uniref:OmpH family outer membrane protein n=1 Tax=Pontitalea aquivivens TaxID=3388663 RepID=UPI003970D013
MVRGAGLAALVGLIVALPIDGATAQEPGAAARPAAEPRVIVPSPVLTLDWDRLYEGSLWGRRVRAEFAAASAALQAENTRITEQLTEEERSLTERRATLDAEIFRREADAFDARVTEIRAAQEEKARAIGRKLEEERQAFVQAAIPQIDAVLQARGAVVMLDARAIIRGLAAIDVTGDLAARVDAVIGPGGEPAAGTEPPAANGDAPQAPPAQD